MDQIRIRGGRPLRGSLAVGGAKNAALPLMVASLLTDETLTLAQVPHLADIATLANLLAQHGVVFGMDGSAPQDGAAGRVLELTTREITSTTAPYDLVRKMRASVLVLGPLVARCGVAKVSLPGGCAIGARPVDLHIKGLVQMGAQIELEAGYILASAPNGLHGAQIVFPTVSVGATENLLMAACLAKGETVLVNAAREPEVTDLARCLIAMGAQIEGLGTDTLRIQGKDRLHAAYHTVVPDRIETGTYAMAAAITGGDLELINGRLEHIQAVDQGPARRRHLLRRDRTRLPRLLRQWRADGSRCHDGAVPGLPDRPPGADDGADVRRRRRRDDHRDDLREPLHARAGTGAHGRQDHRPWRSALVRGVKQLTGAPVMATDLRASSSLVLAGLAAEGETEINRVYHLDRGYERLEEKLSACGADIERVKGNG